MLRSGSGPEQTLSEEVRVTVHVADPKRFASIALAVILVAVVLAILLVLTGSEPVPIGRS